MASDWIDTPESTHIDAIRYESDTQDAFVRFDDGSVYCYFDVPKGIFDELLNTRSKGRYVEIVFRRRYRFQRMN